MSVPASSAEALLLELGISSPSEINLDVIAHYAGARIKFAQLDGCEARIIGVRDRAIIRVRQDARPRRQRFSIAHELGHWRLHRGLNLICGENDLSPGQKDSGSREAAANSFAASLLMPGYLLDGIASQHEQIDFASIKSISDIFDTSQTATAMRLLHRRHAPLILATYGPMGRGWWKRSIDVPLSLAPPKELHPNTEAFRLTQSNARVTRGARRVSASMWFPAPQMDRFVVLEDCLNYGGSQVLVLLNLIDEKLLGYAA